MSIGNFRIVAKKVFKHPEFGFIKLIAGFDKEWGDWQVRQMVSVDGNRFHEDENRRYSASDKEDAITSMDAIAKDIMNQTVLDIEEPRDAFPESINVINIGFMTESWNYNKHLKRL